MRPLPIDMLLKVCRMNGISFYCMRKNNYSSSSTALHRCRELFVTSVCIMAEKLQGQYAETVVSFQLGKMIIL